MKNLKASKQRNRHQAKRRAVGKREHKCRVEKLELRNLLAAGSFVQARTTAGILVIDGTDDADTITTAWQNNNPATKRIAVRIAGQAGIAFNAAGITQIKVSGYNGNDVIQNLTNLPMTAMGGVGNDRLVGGFVADKLYGEAGNDLLYGKDGDDLLDGGSGNDQIWGGRGNDRLYGMSGFDKLFGDENNDILDGGDDADLLYGGIGNDRLVGGLGNDRALGDAGDDTIWGGDGNDQLYGGLNADLILGGPGNDKIYGDAGNDELRGEAGADYIRGGANNDLILGGDGVDDIDGEEGFDSVYGGGTRNSLTGEVIDGNTIPILPVIEDIDVSRVNSGTSIPLPKVDADGDTIQYTFESSNARVKVTRTSTGLLIRNSRDFLGTANIIVLASDGKGLTYSRSFSFIARNQLPQVTLVENVKRLQSSGEFGIFLDAKDVDGDQLNWNVTSSSANVAVRMVQGSVNRRKIFVKPTDSFLGTATITVTVDDGSGELVTRKFQVQIIANKTVQSFAYVLDNVRTFVRLDTAGNIYTWQNVGVIAPKLIAENTRAISVTSDGMIYRLGTDGNVSRRDALEAWTTYAAIPNNITNLHAAAGYLFLIPKDGGTLGVLDPKTGNLNANFIPNSLQNVIAAGNLHTLDSAGNLYVNGALHVGPPVFSGPTFLFFAALGRVREVTVAHNSAYYLTMDQTVYRVHDLAVSVRLQSYRNVDRIRGLGATLYIYSRETGVESYWEEGGLGGSGASIGARQKFASDSKYGYVMEGSRLYRIPPGVDENPIEVATGIADIVGNGGRLYQLTESGTLSFRRLDGTLTQIATDVRNLYEVGRKLYVLLANGQLHVIIDGALQRIAIGVRQFSHSGNFFAGQPYLLYEDGRVAELNQTTFDITILGGSPLDPYSAIAVGDGVLLALKSKIGAIEMWNGSSFSTPPRPYSSAGRALNLVEANGIAVSLFEDRSIFEWRSDRWIFANTNYSPTESIIGIDFTAVASDQDRVFAIDSDGNMWTIPLNRDLSSEYGRGDWLSVQSPLNTNNIVYQLVEAGGRIYARQAGTIFEFSDTRDYTDSGDWKIVGGAKYTANPSYYWDMVSAAGELFVRDDTTNSKIFKYGGAAGIWTDVSGGYRFNKLGVSTEGNLVGLRAPNDLPIAYIGNSWEETTLLWRRGRVLTISGRDQKDDYLKLAISGDYIVATVNDPNGQQVFSLTASAVDTLKSFYFLKSEIDQVVFHGLGGNDTLELDSSWNSFAPIIGYGGKGNDTFTGRVGYDQFFGESDKDTIYWELDLTSYLNGAGDALNTQADMLGDHIVVDVILGRAVRVAFDQMQQFITERLKPVTDFLNSDLVSIKEFNFRISWRQAISKIRGLKELVRYHDELIALRDLINSLPVNNGKLRIGQYDVTGTTFDSIVGVSTSPFVSLNTNESIKKLRSYGIDLPFLLDGKELVKVTVGLPVELVTINTKLSTWLTPSQLADANLKKSAQGIEPIQAISLAKGVILVGPVPVQWELKFNYGFDLGLVAGLDTRGIATGGLSKLREGLYLRSFSLTAYGKLIGEAGWDAGLIAQEMPDLQFIELIAPRAEIVGEIGISQTYTYSNGSKTYLYGKNDLSPTLTIKTTLFGALRLEAEVTVRAKGWLSDYIEGAEEIVEQAADAYVEVMQNIYNILGVLTGQRVKRVRRPEVEIPKEVSWSFIEPIADFEQSTNTVRRL